MADDDSFWSSLNELQSLDPHPPPLPATPKRDPSLVIIDDDDEPDDAQPTSTRPMMPKQSTTSPTRTDPIRSTATTPNAVRSETSPATKAMQSTTTARQSTSPPTTVTQSTSPTKPVEGKPLAGCQVHIIPFGISSTRQSIFSRKLASLGAVVETRLSDSTTHIVTDLTEDRILTALKSTTVPSVRYSFLCCRVCIQVFHLSHLLAFPYCSTRKSSTADGPPSASSSDVTRPRRRIGLSQTAALRLQRPRRTARRQRSSLTPP